MGYPGTKVVLVLGITQLLRQTRAGLTDLLCESPGDYDKDATFEGSGQSCEAVVNMFFGMYSGVISLSSEQCDAIVAPGMGPGGTDMNMRLGLLYVGLSCCKNRALAFPCGDPAAGYPQACAAGAQFNYGAKQAAFHCKPGDTDQASCEAVCPGGWDSEASECHVEACKDDEASCSAAGGHWAQHDCIDAQIMLMSDKAATCDTRLASTGYAYTLAQLYESIAMSPTYAPCCADKAFNKECHGGASPVAASHTCGEVKEAYKTSGCCRQPWKPFTPPSRRLAATSTQQNVSASLSRIGRLSRPFRHSNSTSARESAVVLGVRAAFAAAKRGTPEAKELAEKIRALVAPYVEA